MYEAKDNEKKRLNVLLVKVSGTILRIQLQCTM